LTRPRDTSITLKESDFEIYEDGVMQKIESFKTESDLPLDVAVLMDHLQQCQTEAEI
jgi:hypothetical protein